MNKLLLTLLFLFSTHVFCMDDSSINGPLIEQSKHNKEIVALQEKIKKIEETISTTKLQHQKEIVSTQRRWDVKNAVAPAVYTVLIGGKTAYDVYTLLHTPEIPEWLDITNLTLDGLMLVLTCGTTSWHLLRACCRKPKIE